MSTDTDRAYEVYQRQTEADLPVTIPPGFSVQPEFVDDPYPTLALLQQHYPCFRDWGTNSWWVTRYDDVTSLIADDASFEAGPNPLHHLCPQPKFARRNGRLRGRRAKAKLRYLG